MRPGAQEKLTKGRTNDPTKLPRKAQISFYCRNFLSGNISASSADMIFTAMQELWRRVKLWQWEYVLQKNWAWCFQSAFMSVMSITSIIRSHALMEMERSSVCIGNPHPDDHYYQEKFILHREIPDLKCLIQNTVASVLESAGISGSRRQRARWRCSVQNYCFTRQRSARNRF